MENFKIYKKKWKKEKKKKLYLLNKVSIWHSNNEKVLFFVCVDKNKKKCNLNKTCS